VRESERATRRDSSEGRSRLDAGARAVTQPGGRSAAVVAGCGVGKRSLHVTHVGGARWSCGALVEVVGAIAGRDTSHASTRAVADAACAGSAGAEVCRDVARTRSAGRTRGTLVAVVGAVACADTLHAETAAIADAACAGSVCGLVRHDASAGTTCRRCCTLVSVVCAVPSDGATGAGAATVAHAARARRARRLIDHDAQACWTSCRSSALVPVIGAVRRRQTLDAGTRAVAETVADRGEVTRRARERRGAPRTAIHRVTGTVIGALVAVITAQDGRADADIGNARYAEEPGLIAERIAVADGETDVVDERLIALIRGRGERGIAESPSQRGPGVLQRCAFRIGRVDADLSGLADGDGLGHDVDLVDDRADVILERRVDTHRAGWQFG